jgi:glutathione S-transferase
VAERPIEGAIELWQFPTGLGLPNLSPFCMKVETWLKLAGLPYRNRFTLNLGKAPHGKLPVVRFEGRLIADSHTIVDELSRASGVDLDAALTPAERAVGQAFTRLCSDHLYWCIVHSRWRDEAGWRVTRDVFFGKVPGALRWLVEPLIRRKNLGQLRGHGLGRMNSEEVYRRGAQDIAAIAGYLGEKPYFFGDRATTIDATLYAFLAGCWEIQLDTPLKAAVASHPNLVAYCRRMQQRCFAAGPAAAAGPGTGTKKAAA